MMDFGAEFGAVQGRTFRHPVVCLVHVAFRTAALLVYLFGGLFSSSSFIGVFVAVVLLLSVDFWTVKNISGRILVGLRWWNYIDENGESAWVFESRKSSSEAAPELSPTEVRFFWINLVAAPFLWLILFLTALFSFKFQWLVLVTIGLALTGSNLIGYLRCKIGQQGPAGPAGTGLSGLANSYVQKAVMGNVIKTMTDRIAAGMSGSSKVSSPFGTQTV